MAKKATAPSEGHSLVIVESPAKARTISKFLGKGYTVEASIGHIRDLPQGKKEMPADLKDEEWAKLGVNVNDRFTPVYVVPQDKKSHITKLKKLLKESQNLYLATDEDREGEAISWHLQEVLKPKVPVHRLVFHEITNEAILNALETPREIDDGLVKAQETRRILDRLYGYEISEFLWRKKLGRSAGRVQSVAVRLIVQREWERRAFRSATYWDLTAQFSTSDGQSFDATLVSVDGRKIPSGKDFDSATGQIKDPGFMLMDETGAQQLLQKLKAGTFAVTKMQVKPYTQKPAAPFTTSTMQQEANRKLGFTARRTMSAAQSLYENGYITYMRTDSTSLAKVAVDAARELVGEEYGKDYLPEEPRTYRSTVRNAQEAHEAIRPAGNPFRLPDSLKGELAPDQFKLFELIWKRTVASQMQNARGRRVTITVEGEGSVFQVSGKTIDFPGFLRAYVEGADDPNAELADKETLLPAVEEGQAVSLKEVEPKSHTTQPPSRFSEAALTRELEQRGIGRPSTYASIIETIQTRNYVFKKGNALVPTWNAFSMVRLMEEHFPSLVDYEFTANMEGLLDSISRQEAGNIEYLEEFYFGKETPGLKGRLETKIKEVDPRAISTFPLGTPEEGEHLEVVNLRVGQYGPYLEQGERKASLPEDLPPDELTLESALELLKKAETGDEPLGICPDTHKPVFVKSGRFGPYVQLGLADEGEKPKNAGLLKGMSVEDITLEVALKLLSLPRQVGEHPDSKEVIEAFNGRYGPYIKCGSETRSLPDDVSPLDVQLEQSLFLLSQPKRRGRSAPKEPIKTFESSPITQQPIRLLEGRYGPYVTDGETNASLPKGTETETVTFEQALQLLAERAAKGPSRKKKKTKKKATKKKSAKKKATKKKSAKKKATKKKAVSAESVDEGG
ncbi:MAG: type I DNA topoisomerase [Planctomycetota bacterium]|nr:type I DNA topoisomerase [Planctomycetota bacterium]